jgi:amidase
MADLDLLTADVRTLQQLLSKGSISSVELVEKYVLRIKKYDHFTRAVIQLTDPEPLHNAALKADLDRKAGRVRGPLHGIPILIKVSFPLVTSYVI